jgi:hypothetical protein
MVQTFVVPTSIAAKVPDLKAAPSRFEEQGTG